MPTLRRRLGALKFELVQAGRAWWYRLPLPSSRRYVRELWEQQAEYIHSRWGEDSHDFPVLERLITRHRVRSLLDVGCGSGRLFRLYQHLNIETVIGVDISEKALALARARYPAVELRVAPIEDLAVSDRTFDFAVCNRVLQHVPPLKIRRVIERLARASRYVYVNELSTTDDERENYYMVRHDYAALFARERCRLVDEGLIGDQRYQLYDCEVHHSTAR